MEGRQDHSKRLAAGAAMVDITPKAGTHLGGEWQKLRKAEHVEDHLYARCIILRHGYEELCIISLDSAIITRQYSDRIKVIINSNFGINEDSIIISTTQTHSAPAIGNIIIDNEFEGIPPEHEYLRGSQAEYCDWAVERTIEAVTAAREQERPVQAAAGRAMIDGLAFNRRAVLRNGKVSMPSPFPSITHPLGLTDVLYLEGPTDPEVSIFCLRDDDMRMVAMILHHTCHPVNVFANARHTISADWPGSWATEMQNQHGEQSIPLVFNGCCGNINPWPVFVPDFKPDHIAMGHKLAEASARIIETLEFQETSDIDWAQRTVGLPLRKPAPADLARAQELIEKHPTPIWSDSDPLQVEAQWMDAAMLIGCERERARSPVYEYDIQALRVGNTAFVGLAGEPFVEAQLAIKLDSPFAHTLIAHGTNDCPGYIAPRSTYQRGGHEIRDIPAKWAKLEQGAMEAIVENTTDMLQQLFAT